jgi:sterol desaturase/sphingolipid hydroxylase (fatty acid hydroxylase superfamily)
MDDRAGTASAEATRTTTARAGAAGTDDLADDASTWGKRRSIPLKQVARVFAQQPTPWLLAAAVVGTWTARALVGSWDWGDLAVVLGYLAIFPVIEWIIHTSLLHWRPKQVGRRTMDPLIARKHREHHADPQQLDLIFIPVQGLLAGAVLIAVIAWAIPSTSLGLTYAATAVTLGLLYEWTHYLIHTDYRPKTAVYRAIWRHHRLHHYKNEHYWFTVTSTNTADRLFGTQPRPADVPTSPTARDLLGELARS